MSSAKQILVIYTGGTMGMQAHSDQSDSLAPVAGFLPKMLQQLPELQGQSAGFHGTYDLLEYDPLLDSSDMTPDVWLKIAADIESRYTQYDGFVVIHGTDTLAYTSSALSFFVENTRKPIVVTGSQLPFGVPRSDARNNIVSAMQVACDMPEELAQVCVVFGSRILRGNRATKTSASAYDAFQSPRSPQLGSIGIDINYNLDASLGLAEEEMRVCERAPAPESVAVVRLFPGFSDAIIRAVCASPRLRGIVLEGFGSGNGPARNKAFLKSISDARQQGIVVVVVAQPLQARVDFEDYAAGSAIGHAGAVSGRDLTTEAALAKLYYLISLDLSAADVEQQMALDIAGEMSV